MVPPVSLALRSLKKGEPEFGDELSYKKISNSKEYHEF